MLLFLTLRKKEKCDAYTTSLLQRYSLVKWMSDRHEVRAPLFKHIMDDGISSTMATQSTHCVHEWQRGHPVLQIK